MILQTWSSLGHVLNVYSFNYILICGTLIIIGIFMIFYILSMMNFLLYLKLKQIFVIIVATKYETYHILCSILNGQSQVPMILMLKFINIIGMKSVALYLKLFLISSLKEVSLKLIHIIKLNLLMMLRMDSRKTHFVPHAKAITWWVLHK